MPEPSTLLVFTAAALALIAIPGPNHIYIAARSLGQGRGAGVASAFGVETGTLVHLFFLAFLPQFVDPDRGPVALQALVLGAVIFPLALGAVAALTGGRKA
jgi:threonine/homoserine/homoserine lactone efflux protein